MTAKYEPNAVNDIVGAINKKMNGDGLLPKINSLLGVEQIVVIAGGAGTTQMYAGISENQSFDLSFRIYSLEPIGPMDNATGYKRAIAALCLYAPALHSLDPGSMLATVGVNLSRTADSIARGVDGVWSFANQKLAEQINPEQRPPDTAESTAARNVMTSVGNHSKAVLSEGLDALIDGSEKRPEHIKNFIDNMHNTLDAVQGFVANKQYGLNDADRVKTPANWHTGMFGGALWNLTICPGLLKHKIPVYVKNWNITPSKEIDFNGNAAYVDFDLTCVMDQVKTGTWWINNIYDSETDAYKNLYKRQTKIPD